MHQHVYCTDMSTKTDASRCKDAPDLVDMHNPVQQKCISLFVQWYRVYCIKIRVELLTPRERKI